MQNMDSEPEHIYVARFQVTPPSDRGLTPIVPLYDSRLTTITPAQASVTPPTHTGLSCKQALVLDILIRNTARTTNYALIGAAVGVSKAAARSAVNQLVKKKYISEPVTVRDGVFQGFSYWTDNERCQQFREAGGASNEKYIPSNHILTPPTHTVCHPSYPPHTHSSSYSDSKLTTNAVDLNEPELLFWVDQGLTAKQVAVWIDQFSMSPESLSQALRFARFDIIEIRNKSQAVPIEKPMNWFFITLRKSGNYPRPQNYKSILELRAEALEEQQRRDENARKKIIDAEMEVKFQKFLSNRDSPLFQELFATLDDFAKDDQFALEIVMKELFKKKFPMGSNHLND